MMSYHVIGSIGTLSMKKGPDVISADISMTWDFMGSEV